MMMCLIFLHLSFNTTTHTKLCRKDTPIPAATATRIDTSASKHVSNVAQVAGIVPWNIGKSPRCRERNVDVHANHGNRAKFFAQKVPLVPYNSPVARTFNSFWYKFQKQLHIDVSCMIGHQTSLWVCNVKAPERFVEHVWSWYVF